MSDPREPAALPRAEITPEELRARLGGPAPPDLLDVREPWEAEIATLSGARLIPIDDLERRVAELDASREVVVYCHHGLRSAAVVSWLRALGVPAVNLEGGIDAWSLRVDSSLARY